MLVTTYIGKVTMMIVYNTLRTYDFGSASWQDQTDHFNMPDHAWNIVSLQINDNDFAILGSSLFDLLNCFDSTLSLDLFFSGGSSAYFALYQGFSFQSYSLPDDITGFPAFLIATSKILLVGGHNIITNDYVDTLYVIECPLYNLFSIIIDTFRCLISTMLELGGPW